jgi:NAD(P)-dependent dehydrogenase (short-subunit alcohol dehydrogenase family)
MQTPWFVWAFGIVLPPLAAFIYGISVLGMYVGFHEWTVAEKWPALAWRIALLGGALAITYGDRYAMAHGSDLPEDGRFFMTLVQSALLWIVSDYFMMETRLDDVVGGPDPRRQLKPDTLKDKIVLITGANSGIGKETARQLAELGTTKIILACRSPERGQEALEELRGYQNDKKIKTQYIVLQCDLGSFESVKSAVAELKNRQLRDIPKVDILVLNAGVMMNDHVITKDKCETMMQANVLGHFLLTRLLLKQKLLVPSKIDPPRVLHLTSSTHQIAVLNHGRLDMDDLFCTINRKYTLFGQYAHSKLGNILFARELARRYSNTIISLAVHPGIVRTEVTRNMPVYLKYPNQWLGIIIQMYQKSVTQGAWNSVFGTAVDVDLETLSSHEVDALIMAGARADPVTVEETDGKIEVIKGIPNGSYLQNCKVRQIEPYTYSETVRAMIGLWFSFAFSYIVLVMT